MNNFLLFFSLIYFFSFGDGIKVLEEGMVKIQGGKTTIGYEKGEREEKPTFKIEINTFWLDEKPVTVGQFRLFVKVNYYLTEAERQGFGNVYNESTQEMEKVKGAYWEYPKGLKEEKAKLEEPVTQISWHDAKAYSNWIKKRLPSEFEIEYVIQQKEKYKTIQGLNGELWEWTDNWYQLYDELDYYSEKMNPKKTLKGGKIDNQSRPSLRAFYSPYESNNKIGFRCAK